ncbi:hypothetical protein JYU34_001577 [Plutella xylostella]|uniref:Uncharacterized protein n=1 Tax=Plutella xylostella TaxID=51655 RepID=A0ABQ7R4C4_PLUXY|nr:hypothetical protein JYU34_001577 [Plutella xylostella]
MNSGASVESVRGGGVTNAGNYRAAAASRRAPAHRADCLRRARAGPTPPAPPAPRRPGPAPLAPRRQLLRTGGACGNSTDPCVPTIARSPFPI